MTAGVLLPRTIPLEVQQSSDPSQHTEADQSIEEGSVIAPQPADDGVTVELTRLGNYEEANRATHGKSGEESLAWILHDSSRYERGNHRKWRREYGPEKDGPEPTLFKFPINLFCLCFANFLFDFGFAAFFASRKVMDPPMTAPSVANAP